MKTMPLQYLLNTGIKYSIVEVCRVFEENSELLQEYSDSNLKFLLNKLEETDND